jgi:branched-chain amino acid transport system substrate-binding protein
MTKLLKTSRTLRACAFLGITALLAGCAGQTTTAASVSGSTLKVYAGQSPAGAGGQPAQDVLDAERLALQQAGGQVGHFKVVLEPLSSAKISDNARTAISDTSTIAYLGELDPHASADSLGITNGAGLLQLTPYDTAIELTQATKAVSGAPTKYYESLKTYGRTFGRVVPAANLEAKVLAQAMSAAGVKKLYVADDGGPYGSAVALAVANEARGKGIGVTEGPAKGAVVGPGSADAVFIGASDKALASQFLDGVAGVNPSAKLFAPSALDQDAFAAGLSAAAQHNLEVSSPGFIDSGPKADLTALGGQFVSAFRAAYGHSPAQTAIFGYEAMDLVLDSLRRAGTQANNRSAVVAQFQRTNGRSSVLGTYSIDGNGDTTAAPYVLSHFRAGRLVPFDSMQG